MSIRKQVRHGGLIFASIPLVLLAGLVLVLASWGHANSPAAEAGTTPGMNLSGPANMLVGQTVELTVTTSPAPSGGVAGYNTEIFLPAGLDWVQRPACTAELVARHSGGQNPVLCTRAEGPQGQPRHVAGTGISPPLPAFDTPLTGLLEIDVRCDVAGTYKVDLTAAGAGASFGAVYFGTDLLPIDVTTIQQDLDADGDTTPDFTAVADSINITCQVPPPTNTPTDTPTHTPTFTPTFTPTPCLVDGATCTPTPTFTATATQAEATATPTATPLPEGASLTLTADKDEALAGEDVDVTATLVDEEGNPLVGVSCTFTIVEKPEGSSAELESDTAVTDDEGQATVTLAVGDVEGTIKVQADCGELSQVLAVEVVGEIGTGNLGSGGGMGGVSTSLWITLGVLLTAATLGLGGYGLRRYVRS